MRIHIKAEVHVHVHTHIHKVWYMDMYQICIHTSICIFRWVLKEERRVRKMLRESSNTWETPDTPFLLRATQRYCLMADMKTSSVRKTGPEFCKIESKSSNDRILERSS